jgi:peptide deformylase
MSILKVARLGHPILRLPAAPIAPEYIHSPAIQGLIADMVLTMREYDGVGLAGVQVHESRQIAVLEVAENPRYPDKPAVPLTVLINPSITVLDDDTEDDWEGCLSIPELRGKVSRHKRIRVSAYDALGERLHFTASGFHARVIQHEWDHLQGKVYLDRMRDFSTLSHLKEFTRYWIDK